MNAAVQPLHSARALEERLKRAFDLLAATALLLVTLPLTVAVSVLVRFSSPGPVFFRQQRVGLGGRLFWLYKFRTMRLAKRGLALTARGDSRITPVGKWLRHYKLDELPQLLNVLRGDMSMVGPRPEVPEYVRHYSDEQRHVLDVRPGITGVSQLEFRHEEELLAGRSDVEAFYLGTVMPAKLDLDLRYIRERTLGGDVRLILRTAAAIVNRSPHSPVTD